MLGYIGNKPVAGQFSEHHSDRHSMRTFSHFPDAALSLYIDRIWGWEADDGKPVPLPTLLPGTGAEMVFHYHAPFRAQEASRSFALDQTHLLCLRRRPLALSESTSLGFIAVRFRAGALHHFTAVPGEELIDQQPRAQDLWGAAGKSLGRRVIDARSNPERVRLLEEFLFCQLDRTLNHYASDRLVATAASLLYRDCAEGTVAGLAARLGLGRRQLERRFQGVTGLTLVEARRLARFQKTARKLLLDPSTSCADAALMHGYYDQSHFIREFRTLTSQSPLAYLGQARARTHFYNTSRPASEKIRHTPRLR